MTDTEVRMAHDLLVVYRAPDESVEEAGSVYLKQPNLGDDDSVVVLTLHQLPALIAELQRIYDTQKKGPKEVTPEGL